MEKEGRESRKKSRKKSKERLKVKRQKEDMSDSDEYVMDEVSFIQHTS
jgi:hypothetical protein